MKQVANRAWCTAEVGSLPEPLRAEHDLRAVLFQCCLSQHFNVVTFSNGPLIVSVCYDFVLNSGDETHRADIDMIRVRLSEVPDWGFHGLSQSLETNARPLPASFYTLPVHYSLRCYSTP
jgi:hypothetical protein